MIRPPRERWSSAAANAPWSDSATTRTGPRGARCSEPSWTLGRARVPRSAGALRREEAETDRPERQRDEQPRDAGPEGARAAREVTGCRIGDTIRPARQPRPRRGWPE